MEGFFTFFFIDILQSSSVVLLLITIATRAMGNRSIEKSYIFAVRPCGYTPWSCWSDCDASCGDRVQSRERSCTNPPPSIPGYDCSGLGPSIEVRQCYGPIDQIGMWISIFLR